METFVTLVSALWTVLITKLLAWWTEIISAIVGALILFWYHKRKLATAEAALEHAMSCRITVRVQFVRDRKIPMLHNSGNGAAYNIHYTVWVEHMDDSWPRQVPGQGVGYLATLGPGQTEWPYGVSGYFGDEAWGRFRWEDSAGRPFWSERQRGSDWRFGKGPKSDDWILA